MISLLGIPSSLISLILVVLPHVFALPATVSFTDCFNGSVSQKLNISTVYAQVLENDEWGRHLNLTVLGDSPQEILGFTNSSSRLATLFTSTSVLTLNAWTNSSYLCSTLRPPSPLPSLDSTNSTYCPIPAGPFAFSSTIPWGKHRGLTTLYTRLRAVDPFSNDLLCIEIATTPLDPQPNSPYGSAKIILWATVALAIAYWVVVGIARIVSAWGRGITRHERGIWSRAQSAGFILASAISGERLATSPALIRYSTPSVRDVIFHTQWCTVLAMVSVEWPPFVYPLLTQTAWSTLSYNITLIQTSAYHHWDPLFTTLYSPPSNFADQFSDSSSPLYINASVPNRLFTLPQDAAHGISSFAYALGLRPQDLFPICLILFLSIIAVTIVISILVWFIDNTASILGGALNDPGQFGPGPMARLGSTRSPRYGNKSLDATTLPGPAVEENRSLNGHITFGANIFRPSSRFALPLSGGGASNIGVERGINSHRAWWRIRSDIGSFHGNVLHGNLVRILVWFHLPVTIFSCYHMTLPRSYTSLPSVVLAALSFTVFSILIPAHLVFRVTFTTTNKLYDETRTLLSLGPLYNHYRHGSQLFASLFFATNLAVGLTVGAGQKSGTTQAIIILVIEVASALVTSVWLPWGIGASMGLISFLFCVARIVVAVLLVILTPTISIGAGAGGWVAYGILIILALVYLALLLMLIVKLVEAIVRVSGGVGFERSRHVVDSGLLGAFGLLGCFGSRNHRNRRSKTHNHSYKATELQPQPQHRDSDLSSYVPPKLPHSGGGIPPRFQGSGSGSGKGSTHSGPPPSVLRPEHAMRPYREDSDDEGFIMEAWQPFPRAGYTPLNDSHFQQKPSQSTTTVGQPGFSRVGGGRAHIDAPYAITPGSTHTFPSIGQQSDTVLTPPVFYDDDDESSSPSLSSVARYPGIGTLPPGAMQPHLRTKSQTAIVEDASILASNQPAASSSHARQQHDPDVGLLLPRAVPKLPTTDSDHAVDQSHHKKKPWHLLRRHRVQSEGLPSTTAASAAPTDEEFGGLGGTEVSGSQPGRSFVVIRKPPQGSSPGRSNQQSNVSSSSSTDTGMRPRTQVSSFRDVRAAHATN